MSSRQVPLDAVPVAIGAPAKPCRFGGERLPSANAAAAGQVFY